MWNFWGDFYLVAEDFGLYCAKKVYFIYIESLGGFFKVGSEISRRKIRLDIGSKLNTIYLICSCVFRFIVICIDEFICIERRRWKVEKHVKWTSQFEISQFLKFQFHKKNWWIVIGLVIYVKFPFLSEHVKLESENTTPYNHQLLLWLLLPSNLQNIQSITNKWSRR